jgi:hypothetical protein
MRESDLSDQYRDRDEKRFTARLGEVGDRRCGVFVRTSLIEVSVVAVMML